MTDFFRAPCFRLAIFAMLPVTTGLFAGTPEVSHDSAKALETMVVTASRLPATFGDIDRCVTVLDRETIQSLPVNGIADLLEYVAGCDVRQRGVCDVQADIGMRGGTFEQTLIMIDGVKVVQPQTGHHNLDLPIGLDNVDRIEVLGGPASNLFGANAFGGVINIITRTDSVLTANGRVVIGDFGLTGVSGTMSVPAGPFCGSVSFDRAHSDGYRVDTDFDIERMTARARVHTAAGTGSIYAGYADKAFGAYGFYSSRFPNEWEHTRAYFVNSRWNWENKGITVAPMVSWSRHADDFILNRADPEFSRNLHTTGTLSAEVVSTAQWGAAGATAFGLEAAQESIESTTLGRHQRNNGGLFAEHRLMLLDRLAIGPGLFCSYNTGWGIGVWPGIDLGFRINENVRLFGSAGQSYRVPTFTELYYHDPANVGNPDLQPEKSNDVELGVSFNRHFFSARTSGFHREGNNLINWVRYDTTAIWRAANISRLATNGVELGAVIKPIRQWGRLPFTRIAASYVFLDETRPYQAINTKYDYIRHQANLSATCRLFNLIEHTMTFRYEDAVITGSHALVDSRLAFTESRMSIFAEGTNLFDVPYREIASVPMPGRWIRAGLSFGFPSF